MYKKIAVSIFVLIVLFFSVAVVFYVHGLPVLVQNEKIIGLVKKEVAKNFNVDLEIKDHALKTDLSPYIKFSAGSILISKEGVKLLEIKNLDGAISLTRVLNKKIILKKLVADNIFADVNKLTELAPKEPQEPEESDWSVELADSAPLLLKNLTALYGTDIKISGKDITLNDDFTLNINNSGVVVNAVLDKKGVLSLALNSKNFNVQDAVKLLLTIPEAREPLSYFGNAGGNFSFDLKIANEDVNGKINFNTLRLNLIPLENLPVTAAGLVTIDSNQILLKNFEGHYGKSKENKARMEGSVKDYMKSADTEIVIRGTATNELTKDYISKLAGVKIELVGEMPTRLTVKSKNNIVDMDWNFRVRKGKDVLLEGLSFSPPAYDRMLRANFRLENDVFKINHIDYFIAETIKRGMDIKPIISITGNLDAKRDFAIKDMGFEFTRPLPSEFLNLFTQAKTFKNGTIAGHLTYIDEGGVPYIDGKLVMADVRIPDQRISIKKGVMSTDRDNILLNADGRFRRSNYHFDGKISNRITLPIVVKDVHFKLDDMDVERILNSLNQEQAQHENDEEGTIVFEPNIIVVEKCNLRLDKGKYRTIEFGNLDANLTLDKNGNLNIQSNKFDFAEGISTLKVVCDLVKQKYYIRLGAKDINIDAVATSLFDLEKQITGKASALLELNTDETFRMNGLIKFTVKDGSITQLGFIQYVLNAAALFRNPTLLSPSTIMDLVNVPEGTFKTIDGEMNIKDNIVSRMKIKSLSPQLSSFITGRMNLETGDSSLRIYTKFSGKNKGIAGFLRNISLNNLARKIDIGENRNNTANYYAAEIAQLPKLEVGEEHSQIFLTKVEGDVERNNFISSLKKIK